MLHLLLAEKLNFAFALGNVFIETIIILCWYCQQIYSFMSGFGSLQIKQSDGDSYLEKHANYISLPLKHRLQCAFFTILRISMTIDVTIGELCTRTSGSCWGSARAASPSTSGTPSSGSGRRPGAPPPPGSDSKTWASHLKCFHADVTLIMITILMVSDGVNDVYILPLNISKMLGSRKMNCTSIGEILSEWCNMQGRDRWKIKLFVEKTQSNDMSYSAVSNL